MSEPVASSGKGMKLHTKILLGLVVGLVFGITVNLTVGTENPTVEMVNDYVAVPVGQVFLRLLFMVVMPLVFASIALGVAGIGDIRKAGRIGGKAIGYFFVTTALATSLGLIVVNLMRPWERIAPETRAELMERFAGDAASRVQTSQQQNFGVDTFINIVPRNPIDAAARTDLLGVIFFGLSFGAALTLIPAAKAKPMIDVLEGLNAVVTAIIHFAMLLAPFGVAALIFTVSSRFGFDLLIAVAAFVVTVLVALLAHVTFTLSAIIRFLIGMSPLLFYSRIRAALVTAFSTSSSAATLPTAIDIAQEQLGVPLRIAGFVLPIGSTMCMNGTAIFEGITVIFLAEIFGVDLSLGQMTAVMIMCVITAIGAAGVPGGSIPLLVGVLTMFGVPGEGIAIVLGVDRILDMSRTTVNVCSDLTAATWVARSERMWSPDQIPAPAKAIAEATP
ncbi:MAG TPA: dicarboxylate/amino acid:cation symporter [Vicinamibacterales bacterium]|nr:dicarboxylate/amino acid:cation symporter [Vicinamibacterales bacterium]